MIYIDIYISIHVHLDRKNLFDLEDHLYIYFHFIGTNVDKKRL